ncbi:DUF3168 domain-containing protein [Kingella kingae]|uniref:tail completion protein gp17 n=1 Tax=Kingella kingae TaxID=504 RepID=UPI0025505BD9|nr:DUF3168 domain-containing protein [Kingella kingae]MDK4586937.1 DUF3168 domain-containing protein [Kingella kingae]MDK4644462.1 DUF3168 domain-containing protein [Kingella kingae]MDK4657134.1 DUF3168 domain-containing protein [Kingella kingae]MDK4670462.1 DUF3168 domain-containing protein [Kingella kingae]
MNDLEQIIHALLEPIAPTYPEHLPEKSPLPALVYQRQGGQTHNTSCDDDYTADFRIAVYAKHARERASLVQKTRDAMRDAGFEPEQAPVYEFDFNLKAHVAVLIYLVD